MPVFSKETAKTESDDGAGNPCGPYHALLFSDSGGLTSLALLKKSCRQVPLRRSDIGMQVMMR